MTLKSVRSVDAEGRTVQEAIRRGLATLGARRNQVTVQILAEESQGLFGMRGAKPAKVRLVMKETKEQAQRLS